MAVKKCNSKGAKEFHGEVRHLAALDHPNIIKLLGYDDDDKNVFVMLLEYAENGSLFDFLHST